VQLRSSKSIEGSMDLKLAGKSALVTGSTAGIGFSIANVLAREGASVIVNGRTEARVNAAVQKIGAANPSGRVAGIAADMGVSNGVEALAAKLPGVDILINNLGAFEPKAFAEIDDADWFKIFEVNVMSGVRLSRYYLPGMLAANWGRIIFISSESGLNIPSEMIHYGVTKTAQIALARGLAATAAGTGVTVNSVLPGPTRSEGAGVFIESMAKKQGVSAAEVEKQFFEKMRPSSLIRRLSEPEEIASMVAYLCSPLASSTTGAAVRVDGGVVQSIV
jgi:NAD(P)-dependent dehydrogenase (short-subunit alcohol dehydrogenase family)